MAEEVLFDDPGSAEKVEWKEFLGRLLLFYPKKQQFGVVTEHGEKDPVTTDFTVLDGPGAPVTVTNAMVFPGVLIGQLKNNVGTGRPVLGRLEQGPDTKGNRPWQLAPATDEEKKTATDFIRNKPAVDSAPPF